MTSEVPRRFPVNFGDWPRAQQVEWVAAGHTRAGLLRYCLSTAGWQGEQNIEYETRVDKEMLATIYLELAGVPQ